MLVLAPSLAFGQTISSVVTEQSDGFQRGANAADVADFIEGDLVPEVSLDTTPVLGGDLDTNNNDIVSPTNTNIDIIPAGTGNVKLGNFVLDADQTVGAGQDDYVITYNHSTGLISLEATTASGNELTSSAVITDNEIVVGDGGARGVNESNVTIDPATGNTAGMNNLTITGNLSLGAGGTVDGLDISAIDSDDVPEGSTNLYVTATTVKDALEAGAPDTNNYFPTIENRVYTYNSVNTGSADSDILSWQAPASWSVTDGGSATPIGSVTPDSVGSIYCDETGDDCFIAVGTTNTDWEELANPGSGLGNVVEDTTPQLGGALDVNSQQITSAANGDVDIEPNGTGNVLLGNFEFDADQAVGAGQDNYVLTYDNGTGHVSLEAAPSGGSPAFSDITSATNTTAAMVVGTGASLGTSGSGTIVATSVAPDSINAAAVAADSIGTSELDDDVDTPLAGEWVQVDTGDQAGFTYRTDAEARSDLGLGSLATQSSVDIGDDTNLAAGRSLTLTGDSVAADAELYTRQETFIIETATTTDDLRVKADGAITLTGLDCVATGATTPSAQVMTVMECTSAAGSCASSGYTVTLAALTTNYNDATGTDSAIDDGDWWGLDTTSLTTAADLTHCTVTYTVDD